MFVLLAGESKFKFLVLCFLGTTRWATHVSTTTLLLQSKVAFHTLPHPAGTSLLPVHLNSFSLSLSLFFSFSPPSPSFPPLSPATAPPAITRL